MRPCTRELSLQKSSLERRNTPYGTNIRKTNFPAQSALDAVVNFYFCCNNMLIDRMVQQRHVG
jgi:hypothetical protein